MLTWMRATLIGFFAVAALGFGAGEPVPQPAPVPQPLIFPPRQGSFLILPGEAIDGDTIRFYWLLEDTGRLRGINAPELHGPDAVAGKAAKVFLAGQLTGKPLTCTVDGREKYGRALITIYGADGKSINRALVDGGFAVPYLEGR